MPLHEPLRQAMAKSGMSATALAKAANVAPESVEKLLRGEDVLLSVAERLAEFLGLELQPVQAVAKRMAAENPAVVRQAAHTLAKKVGVNLNPEWPKPLG